MKNDSDNIPVRAGNVGRIIQLVSHSVPFIFTPQDVDFIIMKAIKYITDTVPGKYIKELILYNLHVLVENGFYYLKKYIGNKYIQIILILCTYQEN